MQEIGVQEGDRWNEIIRRSFQYDFYQLAEYHALAERRGEGQAQLFVHERGAEFIALPLLLRPLNDVEGLAAEQRRFYDATSVYGYAGPVASVANPHEELIRGFHRELQERAQTLGIVAAFSRLHPLIPQRGILGGIGASHAVGQTVSIDLSLPLDTQRAQFRKNHKEGINRLHRAGVECIEGASGRYLDAFVAIYRETMTRVGAADLYFFERSYFESLMRMVGGTFHLFVALKDGEVIGGGIFSKCDGIVQYHLGGTRSDALKIAPMKLVFDRVRLWATEQGQRVFHLGGGVGSQQDSLFAFKAGFSETRHNFSVWRWIVMPDAYEDLSSRKDEWGRAAGLVPVAPGFFPRYRAPFAPAVANEFA